ncbi:MAG: hypothetical protein INH41_15665 [Myxococcaceae bacterium]|nr:hypothetical protein [Myxococcaceae bacterium]
MCTDCHRGENPFIIHPEKKAFEALIASDKNDEYLQPANGWYLPLVASSWRQNPGPLQRIRDYASKRSCRECHELPEVDAQGDFCSEILEQSVGRIDETMPPREFRKSTPAHDGGEYFDHRQLFREHINVLRTWCSMPPAGGDYEEVAHVDDLSVLSPPTVVAPYTCSPVVSVRGVIPGATVRVFKNAVLQATTVNGGWNDVASVELPSDVVATDEFWADQAIDGAVSLSSDTVFAVDYPGAVPSPVMRPGIAHRCANVIGVRSVAGARVTASLLRAGQAIETRKVVNSSDWTEVSFLTQFELGDRFELDARLCTRSPPVFTNYTSEPPMPLPELQWPVNGFYAGAVHAVVDPVTPGSFARLSSVGSGTLLLGDTYPVADGRAAALHLPSSPLGRPLAAGESLEGSAVLACPGQALTGVVTQSDAVRPCKDLPAARIATPRAGDRHVNVEVFERGARIRVLRAGVEIADGAPPSVRLKFPAVLATGDKLLVLQQLGECFGTTAYGVFVVGGQ